MKPVAPERAWALIAKTQSNEWIVWASIRKTRHAAWTAGRSHLFALKDFDEADKLYKAKQLRLARVTVALEPPR